jgi:DNA replication protein DnaC
MEYKFIFNKQECWFNKVCNNYNTPLCNDKCSKYCNLHFLAEHSLLTKKQQHPISLKVPLLDKDEINKLVDIRTNIVDFVKSGKNLLIQSPYTGNGKSTWAHKLTMQYLSSFNYSEKPKALFINVPKFCIIKKDMIAGYTHKDLHYILNNIEKVDLVVWDDLAVTEMTPYDYLNIYVYINQRIDAGKSNIYTSNYVGEKVAKVLGDRLYSRVINGSTVVTFNSPDFRHSQVED